MMKILFVALVLLSFSVASAQVSPTQIFDNEAYSGTSADTSSTLSVGTFDFASLFVAFSDSNNCSIKVQYRRSSTDPWATYTATDSTNDAGDGGGSFGYNLRFYTADNIPGASEVRVIVAGLSASGKNSANSGAFFDAWWIRRILP